MKGTICTIIESLLMLLYCMNDITIIIDTTTYWYTVRYMYKLLILIDNRGADCTVLQEGTVTYCDLKGKHVFECGDAATISQISFETGKYTNHQPELQRRFDLLPDSIRPFLCWGRGG